MKAESTPTVDCITFGSPCQDLSVAGKRAGLEGERSGLFMDAVRVIKEMFWNSFGKYPKFAVWENVPGAFSSNKGEDFRVALEELARIKESGVSIPRPENGKWAKAGFITGNGWSIAWRTFDARFWGVPQRRRRVAVVLDLGGQRAGEVLFERTSVSGHLEPNIPPWKGIARDPARGVAGHDRVVEGPGAYTLKIRSGCEGGGKGPLVQIEKSATLSTLQDQTLFVLQGNMIDRDVKQNGSGIAESETMFTLNATDRHGVAFLLNDEDGQSIHSRVTEGAGAYGLTCKGSGDSFVSAERHTALSTGGGMPGQGYPTVLCRAHGQSNAETLEEICPTLNCNHEQPIVFRKATKPHSKYEAPRWTEDAIAGTLNTFDVGETRCNELVVFESHSQDARYTQQGDTAPACTAQWGTGGNNMPPVAEKYSPKTAHTLRAKADCSFREDSETFIAEKGFAGSSAA